MLQLDCESPASRESLAAQGKFDELLQGDCGQGPCHRFLQLEGRLPGASSCAESMLWPLRDMESLEIQGHRYFGRDFAADACVQLAQGVLLTTDYSGMGCPEEALTQVLRACKARFRKMGQRWPDEAVFQCQRAGDVTEHCRTVLANRSGIFRPMCVHGNIMDRCPKKLWTRMEKLRTSALEAVKARVAQGKSKRSLAVAEVGRATVRKIAGFMLGGSSPQPPQLSACAVHQRKCSVRPGTPPGFEGYRLHIAGICCYDWSSMGGTLKWLGPSMPVFMQWARERFEAQEDVILIECVLGFDSDMLGELFEALYELQVLRLSPTLFGDEASWKKLQDFPLRVHAGRFFAEASSFLYSASTCSGALNFM